MALPENFVSRADLGWGNTAASYANISQGLVIHYDSGNLGLASKPHSACVQYWHNTRAFHRGPQRGWADIGYSFFSCPHDYILEGRGLNRQQAAQPGGNATHYSVTLARSEEHTSELQSRPHLVCRLLLEKKTTILTAVPLSDQAVSTSFDGGYVCFLSPCVGVIVPDTASSLPTPTTNLSSPTNAAPLSGW